MSGAEMTIYFISGQKDAVQVFAVCAEEKPYFIKSKSIPT